MRARNATLALLVRHAVERSATFRELVRTIDASDGLVYIGPGGCPGAAVRACLIHQLTKAGPNRVLHILVDTNRGERDVMSAIAHELAHAIEVLSDPRISNDEALIAFYRAHGVRMKGVLETYAAIQAGVSVGTELSRK